MLLIFGAAGGGSKFTFREPPTRFSHNDITILKRYFSKYLRS